MIVWIIERTDYESEGCPERSSGVDEIVMGQDAAEVEARALAREAELNAGAYALTSYCTYPVEVVHHV